jgi:2-keto-4-pentenoate hydratase/2-oxohepta-3-ene-1,7-dioic acid hydratase in catechol pathway
MGGLSLTQPVGSGLGVQEPFAIATPAAGSGFTFTADGRGLRRLSAFVLTLTTSATVAARYLKLEWRGGDNVPYAVAAVAATLAASLTQRYVFALNYAGQAWNTGTDGFAPLPAVFLSPGDSLVAVVDNIAVGDTLTLIRGTMERFPLDGVGLPAAWWE